MEEALVLKKARFAPTIGRAQLPLATKEQKVFSPIDTLSSASKIIPHEGTRLGGIGAIAAAGRDMEIAERKSPLMENMPRNFTSLLERLSLKRSS
ncbi:MAG: hypothetical protein V1827_03600 [Candidatus Micrarchaeota archaeon]